MGSWCFMVKRGRRRWYGGVVVVGIGGGDEGENEVVLVEEMVVEREGEGGGKVAGQGKAMAANSSLLVAVGNKGEGRKDNVRERKEGGVYIMEKII